MTNYPTNETTYDLTDLLHVLFCRQSHDDKMENLANRIPEACYYELEKTLVDPWSQPDHQRMLQLTMILIESYEFEDVHQAMTFFDKTLELCQQLNELISEHPESSEFVRGLIG